MTVKKEPLLRAILAFVGIALFIVCLPAVSWVFNIGTVAGFLLSALLLVLSLFYPFWKRVVLSLKKTKGGRVLVRAVAFLTVLFLLYALTVGVLLIAYADRAPEEGAVLIVLGCKVNGEAPSGMLIERLEAAASYLAEHPTALCIVSGGQGDGEDIPEALAMFRYLTKEKGIAEERILMEDRSKNTVENLRFSAELMKEKGLGTNVAVVTNGFHQFRASVYASMADLEAKAVNVPTGAWSLPTFYLRELIGVAVMCLTGGRY